MPITPSASSAAYVPLAEVVRNDFVEGVHFGALVLLNADGTVALSRGDVERPMHPRSANKLMQAAAMRDLGLRLSGQLLALSAASHWGQDFHVAGVRSILGDVGLDETALQTTPAFPEDAQARMSAIRAGLGPTPIQHGCSGKHAAMLATCRLGGWDVATHLDIDHPLQVALRSGVESWMGEPVAHTAVDGCGAPAWAFSLRALADVYRRAARSDTGSSLGQVAVSMRQYPEYVCGEQSEVTGLMRAVPGLLLKDGAESVYVGALSDGGAVALKVSDGGFRAGQVVLVAALRVLGAEQVPGVDRAELDRWQTVNVLGHGEPVGRVRALPFD